MTLIFVVFFLVYFAISMICHDINSCQAASRYVDFTSTQKRYPLVAHYISASAHQFGARSIYNKTGHRRIHPGRHPLNFCCLFYGNSSPQATNHCFSKIAVHLEDSKRFYEFFNSATQCPLASKATYLNRLKKSTGWSHSLDAHK